MAAPLLWLVGVATLMIVWACSTPEWIELHFDQKNCSPVEIATVALFFFQMGFLWFMPPFRPGLRRFFWSTTFSLISFFAICRELDWHKLLITASKLPGATRGTPFKMRFLTNSANPLSDRLIVLACFVLVIGICAGTLLYWLPRLVKGLFRLHPVCWSIAFIGGTVILVQLFDRAPAVLRKKLGIHLSDTTGSLFTALEEGQEMLLPLFAVLAIMQAHFIYNNNASDTAAIDCHREL
ncbi:MAG: hypothetical protein PHU80_06915 [Kiritimatiellae bacterium]|nr:hypothetical protein [Kiritimatiellia bacterium]